MNRIMSADPLSSDSLSKTIASASASAVTTALIRPTPIVAQSRPTSQTRTVPPDQELAAVERILIGLDRFASRLDHENQVLSQKLHLLSLRQQHCPRCNCQPSLSPPHHSPHLTASHLPQQPPAPSSPSPESSFDLVSAEDPWYPQTHPHGATKSYESPSKAQTRTNSLSVSRLPPATPKSPALNAADTSFSLKTMHSTVPTNISAALSSSPQPNKSVLRAPHSPADSSDLAASPLQSLCQDLTRLIWTSTRPLMILDHHHEIEQSADANGTAGTETSMKTKDKAVMTLEEEEIADPVPDIGHDPTAEHVAAVLKAAEERLLRLSDMFQQALHDRDILQNHLNSYYHHMAIDRCIRRDAIRNTGAPSNAATANNAVASGDKSNPPAGGGGVGGVPPSPPPVIMDPPLSPPGAVSFRVGSYGAGSMGYGRGSGGIGGHEFGGIGGMDRMGGRYIGSAMGRGAEPDAMIQFMHMDDLEI